MMSDNFSNFIAPVWVCAYPQCTLLVLTEMCSHALVPPNGLMCFEMLFLITTVVKSDYSSCYSLPVSLNQSHALRSTRHLHPKTCSLLCMNSKDFRLVCKKFRNARILAPRSNATEVVFDLHDFTNRSTATRLADCLGVPIKVAAQHNCMQIFLFAGASGHGHLEQSDEHHELVCERRVRAHRHRGVQTDAVQQALDHHEPRGADRRAPAASGGTGQARRVRGHQSCHQVH